MTRPSEIAPTDDPDLAGFRYVAKKKPSRRQLQRQKQRHADGSVDAGSALKASYALRAGQLEQSAFFLEFRRVFLERLSPAASGGNAQDSAPAGQVDTKLDSPPLKLEDRLNVRSCVGLRRVECVKMLGIGTLTHKPSLFQCRFGLMLSDALEVPRSAVLTADPMYTEVDRHFLQQELGLSVVSAEEAAMHDPTRPTLLFLPHVPKSVTEAALRAFWSPECLDNLVILGNDIRRYPETYPQVKLQRESPCLLEATAWAEVLPLSSGSFEHNNVFNDLALHTFGRFGDTLPDVAFDEHDIEQEHFEINKDEVEKRQRL